MRTICCLTDITYYSSGGIEDAGGDLTNDILEFVPSTGTWTKISSLKEERYAHAVSTITLAEARDLCTLS